MRVASFFCGAGGLDSGFHKSGFDIILSNDINKQACQTYSANYQSPIYCGSFKDIPYEDYNKADCIIGGPPCQGFSINGKMDINDPRNRLIKDYFLLIKDISPKIFVAENVPALLELDKWKTIKQELLEMMDDDYWLFKKVLHCTEFSIHQTRRRTLIIGFKKTEYPENIISIFENILSTFKIDKDVSLYNLLKDIGPIGKENPQDCLAKIVYCKNPVLRKDPYGGFLFNGQGRVSNPAKPARTIIASLGGGHTPIIDENEFFGDKTSFIKDYHQNLMEGGPVGTFIPDFLRRMTIREAKAVQSFPDDYIFTGSKSAIYRQIGNAVPPQLSLVIAQSIMELG